MGATCRDYDVNVSSSRVLGTWVVNSCRAIRCNSYPGKYSLIHDFAFAWFSTYSRLHLMVSLKDNKTETLPGRLENQYEDA